MSGLEWNETIFENPTKPNPGSSTDIPWDLIGAILNFTPGTNNPGPTKLPPKGPTKPKPVPTPPSKPPPIDLLPLDDPMSAIVPGKKQPITPVTNPLIPPNLGSSPAPLVHQFTCAALAAAAAGATGVNRNFVYNLCIQNFGYLSDLPYRTALKTVVDSVKALKGSLPANLFTRRAPKVTSQAVTTSNSSHPFTQQMARGRGNRGKAMVSMKGVPAARSARINVTNRARTRQIKNGILVNHKEMIGVALSAGTTTEYLCASFVANPGKSAMFPWLSSIAVNYDKYRFRKLSVALISNQSTNTVGKIGIGFDYDSTDDVPTDRIEFFALTYHTECSVWDSTELQIPCQGGVRFTNTHTDTDSKLIDLGQILIMVDQVVATSAAVADIIVSYEVELLDAQQALYQTGAFWAGNHTTPASGVSIPFTVKEGPIVPRIVATAANVWNVYLDQGYYEILILLSDAGSPVLAWTKSSATAIQAYALNAVYSTTKALSVCYCKITAPSYLILTLSGSAGFNICEDNAVTISRIAPPVYAAIKDKGTSAVTT